MRTIATAAAAIMFLSATAWADEPAKNETNDPAISDEPIVLSQSEMDGVTAGVGRTIVRSPQVFLFDEPMTDSSASHIYSLGQSRWYKLN